MLKLVRQALTAAVLIAVALRLRRRARVPRTESPQPPPPPAVRSRRVEVALLWTVIAVAVAAALALALMRTPSPRDGDDYTRSMSVEYADETELRPDGRQLAPDAVAETPSAPREPGATSPLAPEPAATGETAVGAASTPVPDPGCARPRRPIDARRVAPDVERYVDRQWLRIERWLRANAPRTYQALAGPGRARTIAVAESQTGLDFPDDLRASLLRHNGSRGPAVFGFLPRAETHLSIRGIRDLWRRMCHEDATITGPDPEREPWNGLMIPFVSFTSPPGGYAAVNSSDGTIGWDDGITGMAPRTRSTRHLLKAVANALEKGARLNGRRPAVRSGTLHWVKAP